MRVNDVTIKVGGEAGSGVLTVGHMLAKLMQRCGLQVFLTNDYPSLIKGGHNTLTVRASAQRIYALDGAPDILIALDKLTILAHAADMAPNGAIIYDSAKVGGPDAKSLRSDVRLLGVPLSKIAAEAGGELFFNQAAVGATLALLGMDLALHNTLIESTFGRKGADVVGKNKQAAAAGHAFIKNELGAGREASGGRAGPEAASGPGVPFGISIQPQPPVRRTLLINGNDAVCAGAVAAGVQLVAEYPMSPSSSVLHWMAAHATKYNIVVKHTEDEIAAMNWLCGAGFAGVRCMTATSGGGFSLMAEALGLAGMAEIPVVVVEDQRAGPSTGLPTYTEQADLQFALHISQGEFPRIVACPGDPAEAFYMAFDVFNMADLAQTPAIILMDKYLAESEQTVSYFKADGLKINRGLLQSDEQMEDYAESAPPAKPAIINGPWAVAIAAGAESASSEGAKPDGKNQPMPISSSKPVFKRHLLTPSGISPRSIPGQKNGIHVCSSYEHDETGFTSEEPAMRVAMVDKRERKLRAINPMLYQPVFFGEQDAEFLLISWGSTKGVALEALKTLKSLGIGVKYMHIRYASPFAADAVRAAIESTKRHLIVEGNSSGQMRALIREKTGLFIENFYGRYDARPLEAAEIVAQVKACIGSR